MRRMDQRMSREICRDIVDVWRPRDLPHLELRRGIGAARPVPRHWHEDIQMCLIESGSGELKYRGANHITAPATLFIVHPAEVHSNRAYERSGCTYRTLFIEPDAVRRIATEMSGHDRGVPFFPTTIVSDPHVTTLFLTLHKALEEPSSSLERESLLAAFAAHLIVRFSEQRISLEPLTSHKGSVRTACDYLVENYSENVLLDQLARLVGLSSFHFSRLFCQEVGMPPHAFQTQVRVARARVLLLQGLTISEVAVRTGFADQSHLTRHFKRLVGVTPGQYRQCGSVAPERSRTEIAKQADGQGYGSL
jgi:AraC-like DNA-binding protein